MIVRLVVLAVLAASVSSAPSSECSFTKDCKSLEKCIFIQDAACLCRFGSCVYDGNPFVRFNECNEFTDCECKSDPDKCFCRANECVEEAWECRVESDCSKLEKCNGKDCRCSSLNTCEPYDCYNDDDCFTGDFDCDSYGDDYTCKCERNTCDLVSLRDDEYPIIGGDSFNPEYPEYPEPDYGEFPPPVSYENATCLFTADCKTVDYCQNIQDAACVCKEQKCTVYGGGFFRGSECDTYNDCPCSGTPEKCFCKYGFCEEEAWDCHTRSDCNKLDKCKGQDCICSESDLCEPSECTVEEDCINTEQCNYEGYTCVCEQNVCELIVTEEGTYY